MDLVSAVMNAALNWAGVADLLCTALLVQPYSMRALFGECVIPVF